MIKKILIGLAAIIALFLIVAATRPADFRVERSAALSASPATLFENVNNHHKFVVWNPFMKLDPNVRNTYSGPESGVGAVCSWDGNRDIGAGSCTIIESKPGELVRCRMDWKRPMEGTATVDFTFKPEGGKKAFKEKFTGQIFGPEDEDDSSDADIDNFATGSEETGASAQV
jgi:hypothetical protein